MNGGLKRAIGLFGGTFNPVHNGHLRCAWEAHHGLGLAETFLLPNAIPPHKASPGITTAHRLAMLKLALADHPELQLDTRELDRDGASFTVDTLEGLRAERPDTPLCFIVGMDSLLSLHRWHQPERILELAHLVVCHRPGAVLRADAPAQDWLRRYPGDTAALHQQLGGTIQLLPVTQQDIASSTIRTQVAQGLPPHFLLPPQVVAYLERHRLYLPQ